MKFITSLLLSLITLSCNQKGNYDILVKQAEDARSKDDYMTSIMTLDKVINGSASNVIKQQSQFIIADIYMNDVKNYSFALDEFKKVLEYDVENNTHKKSLFMFSYICSNYLDMYTEAYNSYNAFLDKYPDDELVPSVLYEIDQLRPIIDSAEKLING